MHTCNSVSGLNKSQRVRRLRFIRSSHGGIPVVALGVVLYVRRKLASLWEKVKFSFLEAFMASLKVLTNHSASPFDDG